MFKLTSIEWQFLVALFSGILWQALSPRLRRFERLAPVFFLAIQVYVIWKFDLAAKESLLLILALLALYLYSRDEKFKNKPALFFMGTLAVSCYFGVWFFLKYSHTLLNYFLFLSKNFFSFPIEPLSQASDRFYDRVSLYPMIGLSFMGFKLIHFLLDKSHGQIRKAKTADVLCWLFFFPTIISGPIQKYQDWQKQREESILPLQEHLIVGTKRMIEGLFLKFVLADGIYSLTIASLTPEQLSQVHGGPFLVFVLLYPLYLYWDFAGYSSMAIGFGHYWGIRLPENFNFPFAGRNIAEFWNRWHITLSNWLKEYLYYPLALAIKRKPKLRTYPNLMVWVPPVLTFLIAGFWHGAQVGYLIFGLSHGLALGWIAFLDKNLPSKNTKIIFWRTSRIGYWIAVICNYLFVSFSLMFFALSNKHLLHLFQRF